SPSTSITSPYTPLFRAAPLLAGTESNRQTSRALLGERRGQRQPGQEPHGQPGPVPVSAKRAAPIHCTDTDREDRRQHARRDGRRSEEHTSELQSRVELV